MDCNNTFTDDQLEAMFTVTDKEMQQIKQSMRCLIERTKHKCKRCTKFYRWWTKIDSGGGASGWCTCQHAEHWKASAILECTLKYKALMFRKTFNSKNKRDILQWLKEFIHSMRPVTEGQTWAKVKAVKWYLSLSMNFCKSTKPGIKTNLVTFHSEVFKSVNIHKFNYQFHVWYNQIVLQIDEFQCNGSGWVVDHLQHYELGTCFL